MSDARAFYLSERVDHLLGNTVAEELILGIRTAASRRLPGQTLGWVQVPCPLVEASIALSIVFVASEIVHARQNRYSVTQHYPWVVAFTFGLLHGFGFAGALASFWLVERVAAF